MHVLVLKNSVCIIIACELHFLEVVMSPLRQSSSARTHCWTQIQQFCSARTHCWTQIQQFCNALGSLFTGLAERSESAFRRVYVMKKDALGNIKTYDQKPPATPQKVTQVSYIEDIKTGEMYLDEPGYVVAVKCALIGLGMPFHVLGKMVWQTLKTPLEIGLIASFTLAKAGKQLVLGECKKAAIHAREGFLEADYVLSCGIFDIVKAPIFGLGCQIAAIYGILKPFHGRAAAGKCANALQNGVSFKEESCAYPNFSQLVSWQEFKSYFHNLQFSYLAPCFQVRGNVGNPRIIVVRREPEYSSLTHIGNYFASC